MTIILKIGGSLITDKDGHEDIDRESLNDLIATIADTAADDIVLVHGAGSFGHPHALDAGIDTTTATKDTTKITVVERAVRELNDIVVDALQDNGQEAVGLHPSSMLTRTGTLQGTIGPVRAALRNGMLPVLHGDVILEDDGASIVSGDEIVPFLADELEARAGICSDLPGILGPEGDLIKHVSSLEDIEDHTDDKDASGGIRGKIETILRYGGPVRVFGPEDCRAFLRGETVGTLVTNHQR